MPQFELENVGPKNFSGFIRGRIAEEAARRGGGIPDNAWVSLVEQENLQGWQQVMVDGEEAGRVRLHQRMQFRRD